MRAHRRDAPGSDDGSGDSGDSSRSDAGSDGEAPPRRRMVVRRARTVADYMDEAAELSSDVAVSADEAEEEGAAVSNLIDDGADVSAGGEVAAGLAAAALRANLNAAAPVLEPAAAMRQRKPTRCSRCLNLGHNVRTCPLASGVVVPDAAPAAVHAGAATAPAGLANGAAHAGGSGAGAAAGGAATTT